MGPFRHSIALAILIRDLRGKLAAKIEDEQNGEMGPSGKTLKQRNHNRKRQTLTEQLMSTTTNKKHVHELITYHDFI